MAGVKISALPTVASALITDIFPAVQGGVTSQETLLQVRTLFGFNSSTGLLAMASGGTNANLTAANGAIPYSTASAFALLAAGSSGQLFQSNGAAAPSWTTATFPSSAGSAGTILRSDGTNWVASTATFANTYAVSTILYASSSNTVSGLAAAQNGVLVSGNTNVPVMLAGPAATGRMLQSNAAAAPSWSTATFPSTGGAAGNILISDGTNYIASTSLWPNTVGSNGKFIISNGTSNGYSTSTIPSSAGATANKVLLSDGTNYVLSTPTFPNASATATKIITSDGTNWIASTALWVNSVGTAGKIIRSDGTTNTYTTSTFADTYAVSTILYAGSANAVSGLATANSSILVTDSGGVPSWSTTLPAFTTSSITFSPTTGGIVGTTTNDNAAAGKVGEYISSQVSSGAPVSLTTTTTANLTSISLTAGDWDVYYNAVYFPASTTTLTRVFSGLTSTSATEPGINDQSSTIQTIGITGDGSNVFYSTNGSTRLSINTTTTYYCVVQAIFAVSTCTAFGWMWARRRR